MLSTPCPVCARLAEIATNDFGREISVACPVCGRFRMTATLARELAAAEKGHIHNALRTHAEASPGRVFPNLIHRDNWREIAHAGDAPLDGPEGARGGATGAATRPPTGPTAFLSYSWDSEEHKSWVRDLAARLRADGVNAILDRWALVPGDQIPSFMERACTESSFVLIVCTPNYKAKSDGRKGGVGYEGDIMTEEVLRTGNQRKFIPILRSGDDSALPVWLAGKYRVDLRGAPYASDQYEDLVCTLHGARKGAPPVAPTPPPFVRPTATGSPAVGTPSTRAPEVEGPIRIEGVIVDEVGTPRRDGTRGSALYRVPFQLSRTPPSAWADAFVRAWDHPSQYTMMHRPGIARVVGDRVILDGTTMDEVAEVHRATLVRAVAEANQQWGAFEAAKRRHEAELNAQRDAHRRSVEDAAKRIRFDP